MMAKDNPPVVRWPVIRWREAEEVAGTLFRMWLPADLRRRLQSSLIYFNSLESAGRTLNLRDIILTAVAQWIEEDEKTRDVYHHGNPRNPVEIHDEELYGQLFQASRAWNESHPTRPPLTPDDFVARALIESPRLAFPPDLLSRLQATASQSVSWQENLQTAVQEWLEKYSPDRGRQTG